MVRSWTFVQHEESAKNVPETGVTAVTVVWNVLPMTMTTVQSVVPVVPWRFIFVSVVFVNTVWSGAMNVGCAINVLWTKGCTARNVGIVCRSTRNVVVVMHTVPFVLHSVKNVVYVKCAMKRIMPFVLTAMPVLTEVLTFVRTVGSCVRNVTTASAGNVVYVLNARRLTEPIVKAVVHVAQMWRFVLFARCVRTVW